MCKRHGRVRQVIAVKRRRGVSLVLKPIVARVADFSALKLILGGQIADPSSSAGYRYPALGDSVDAVEDVVAKTTYPLHPLYFAHFDENGKA